MPISIPRSDGSPLPVGHHKTLTQDATKTGLSSFVLGTGVTSSAFAYDTPVKITATDAGIWIKIGATASAVDQEGEFLGQNSYDHYLVFAGEKISVIGGTANIVPIKD